MPDRATALRPEACAGGRPSGKIVVCERLFAIDWPVVNWLDDPRFDATRPACHLDRDRRPTEDPHPFDPYPGLERARLRYGARRALRAGASLPALQAILRQFVVHHDGLATSRDTFHVLHDERGLSVHFLIDNDGTIYQTLDLMRLAFHGKGVNQTSIGVELCNRGDIRAGEEDYYRRRGQRRDRQEARIHGHARPMWDYTACQYQAMVALGRALARIFPNLPQVYPADSKGLISTRIEGVEDFAGYLGHYHITQNKWDPGCFDFPRLVRALRPRSVWFARPGAAQDEAGQEVADDDGAARRQADRLIENNERAMGGFYPVGPYGQSRLWHGGVHLSLPRGAAVRSPFPGVIVAARQARRASIGSCNFVLTRHRFELRGEPVRFYMLFFHLDWEDEGGGAPWYGGGGRGFPQAARMDVLFPAVPVEAGELLGRVGLAGPDVEHLEPQVHVEVLAREELGALLEPGRFTAIDAGQSGHFCDEPRILGRIDGAGGRPRDRLLDRHELVTFFREDPARASLRGLAVRFQSEWGADEDYLLQLNRSRDFAALPEASRRNLFRAQVLPTLWWDEEVADRTGLPRDYVVWHYHPIEFVRWMAQHLRAEPMAPARGAAGAGAGEKTTAAVGADLHAGDDFSTREDRGGAAEVRAWTLEELSAGYEGDQE